MSWPSQRGTAICGSDGCSNKSSYPFCKSCYTTYKNTCKVCNVPGSTADTDWSICDDCVVPCLSCGTRCQRTWCNDCFASQASPCTTCGVMCMNELCGKCHREQKKAQECRLCPKCNVNPLHSGYDQCYECYSKTLSQCISCPRKTKQGYEYCSACHHNWTSERPLLSCSVYECLEYVKNKPFCATCWISIRDGDVQDPREVAKSDVEQQSQAQSTGHIDEGTTSTQAVVGSQEIDLAYISIGQPTHEVANAESGDPGGTNDTFNAVYLQALTSTNIVNDAALQEHTRRELSPGVEFTGPMSAGFEHSTPWPGAASAPTRHDADPQHVFDLGQQTTDKVDCFVHELNLLLRKHKLSSKVVYGDSYTLHHFTNGK